MSKSGLPVTLTPPLSVEVQNRKARLTSFEFQIRPDRQFFNEAYDQLQPRRGPGFRALDCRSAPLRIPWIRGASGELALWRV